MCNQTIKVLSATIRRLRTENAQLKSALEQAEFIRDAIVSDADEAGALIFGDYVTDENGNDRYSADGYTADPNNPDDYGVAPFTGLDIEQARKVAQYLNAILDADWIDTDGSRQRVSADEDVGEGGDGRTAVDVWAKEALEMLEVAGTVDDLLTWLARAGELVANAPVELRQPTTGERLTALEIGKVAGPFGWDKVTA